MDLEGCVFILTFKCAAKCRHCTYRASPDRTGVMSINDFQNYMTTLTREQSLDWIAFRGGEPFLFYKTLKRCIQIAHKLGQKQTVVFTNGYWGGNQTNAQTKLQELKHAGLTHIWFSVDAFHQEFVPFRSVHIAINTARTIGFDKIAVTSQYLNSVNSKNPFNQKTEEYLKRLRLPDDFTITRNPVFITGRASDQLAIHLKGKARFPRGKCALSDIAGETLKDPKKIEIDSYGNVTICPGLCIGNTKSTPLSRIIREYDYKQHPIIRLLVEDGPSKLLELPETAQHVSLQKYVSECHLCYEIRRQLGTCFPEFLAPETCYREQ